MSTFEDIATGYRRLAADDLTYGLVYTCNGGWIDLGHMNPFSSDPLIGAGNLWRQIEAGGSDARLHWGYHYPPNYSRFGYPREVLDAMREDKLARLPDGSKGFRVRFRMQQPITGGITRHWLVKHNLGREAKRAVALTIFVVTSHLFEQYQLSFEWPVVDWLSRKLRDKPYDSGYSEEDLVSNLVGFYVAVGDMTAREAIDLLRPVSREAAEAMWERYGAVGGNKNRTFRPRLDRETWFDDEAAQMCRDECIGQPRELPAAFRRITPARIGRNLVPLWDESIMGR